MIFTMMIFTFIIRHLPVLLAILFFTFVMQISFIRLFLFLWVVGAIYETILWQFPACIEMRKPIRSQRTNMENEIFANTITPERRIYYSLLKFIHSAFDWKYIFGAALISGIFMSGYMIIAKLNIL